MQLISAVPPPRGMQGRSAARRQDRPCSATISAAPSASSSRARFIAAARRWGDYGGRFRRLVSAARLRPAAATSCATPANRGRPTKLGGDLSYRSVPVCLGVSLAAVSPRRLRPQKAAAPLPRHVASAGAPTGDLARCAVRVRGGTRGGGGARRGDASALLPVRLQRRVRRLLLAPPLSSEPRLLSSL